MDLSDNSREGFRVPLHNVTGEYSHKGVVDKCEVVDISFSGVGLRITHIMTEGDIIDIRFMLENIGKIYCKGKVVSVRGGRIGVNFLELPDKSEQNIHKYIENYTNANINKMLGK